MRITETRIYEIALIELFYESRNNNEAKEKIEIILKVFKIISIFTGENHEEIICKLYFDRNNIVRVGIKLSADKVFMQEKTLYSYRKKYCKIIKEIMVLFK